MPVMFADEVLEINISRKVLCGSSFGGSTICMEPKFGGSLGLCEIALLMVGQSLRISKH